MAAPDRLIRAIAFDLDGTLARTAGLHAGRRVPYDVLARARPLNGGGAVSFGPQVTQQPGRFIVRGVPVAIVTRAPAAYAATLLGILDVDYCRLFASHTGSGSGAQAVASRLRLVSEAFSASSVNLLYVGDSEEDQRAARLAGCRYAQAPWLTAPRNHAALLLSPEIADLSRPGVAAAAPSSARVDAAITRLIDGAASDDDYLLLEALDFRFWLRQHGDPSRVQSQAIRQDMTSRRTPWRYCTQDDWDAVVATGDIGRLTEMASGSVQARLPDQRLMRKLRELGDKGCGETVAGVVADLASAIQQDLSGDWGNWTPVAGPLTLEERGALGQAIRDHSPISAPLAQRIGAASGLSDSTRAVLAHALLLNFCAGSSRPELQGLLLRGAAFEHRRCIVAIDHDEGLFGLPAAVLTQVECQADQVLAGDYRECLRRLFPLRRLSRQSAGAVAFACVAFHSDWGYALSHAKNWHSGSGPEVRTSMLTFPGSILGAHLSAAELTVDGLVSAPVSDFSSAKPGEAALRLAVRAADVSKRPLYPALKKGTRGFVATSYGEGRSVILIEDQVTSGGTVAESVRVLSEAGWDVRAAVAWSASDYTLVAETGPVDRAGMLSTPCPYEFSLRSVLGSGRCPAHGKQ